ncbi:MAG: hypothetical protein PHP23_13215 [Desulfobacterales bacterium]|nr:hypothetical protein [Desulfobacterales bacterium]MDD4072159.1 hypothetical protein [Desulfobacterales bacterium]MDD4394198.1 hypothetical protein [Desulfobacterales bacterium]
MKTSSVKPWNKLGVSKREYLTAKPWKEYGMTRTRFETFILSLQQDIITDAKLRKESDAVREKLFGQTRE